MDRGEIFRAHSFELACAQNHVVTQYIISGHGRSGINGAVIAYYSVMPYGDIEINNHVRANPDVGRKAATGCDNASQANRGILHSCARMNNCLRGS